MDSERRLPPDPTIGDLFAYVTQMHSDLQEQMNQLAERQELIVASNGATLARIAASQSSLQSSIDTIQSSMILSHRQLSLQILHLQSPNKTNRTRLNRLPSEVVALILSWIHPKYVWKLRKLSRAFKSMISTKSFAWHNLSRFLPAPDATRLESLGLPSDIDISYMTAPLSYQTVYIHRHLNQMHTIRWGIDESERTVPHALRLNSGFPMALLASKVLVRLALVNCKITGPIPTEIAHLKNLQELDLDSNALCGTIPGELAELSLLTRLVLSNNRLLCGPLPSALAMLEKLEYLAIRGTGITGSIPPQWGDLAKLKELHLDGNSGLTGSIPRELGGLCRLQTLWLGGCNLSGEIPDELGCLEKLEDLDLSGNLLLRGEVPAALGGLDQIDLSRCPRLILGYAFHATMSP
ncbi:hypothetical protein HDU98_003480 [Podochytrium sp. JEL0797]|nr:hypothetical protein HDU98_003480 [Podochytrium sp. JEL0797]